MKLKKVVSLALAGVLAVSMLAGCGTNKKDGPTQDDNGTVKAGYSAEFGKIVDLKDMDYVTFQDSTVDQAALKKAVDGCSDIQLYAALVGGNTNPGSMFPSAGLLSGAMPIEQKLLPDFVKTFMDQADVEAYNVVTNSGSKDSVVFGFGDARLLNTIKKGVVIAVDGTMSTDAVLTQVNKLVSGLSTLTESGSADNIVADYHYTVSVSLVNRVATSTDLVKADMDFVAVTVTRTGTLAE